MARAATVAVDLPNPIDIVTSPIKDAAVSGAKSMADGVLEWFVDALAAAVAKVGEELLNFLDTSATVSFDQGWWAGPRAQEIWNSVVLLAGVVMLGCLLLAVIQGVIAGEPMTMLKAAFLEVPISVFGIAVLVAVTTVLMGVVDGASAAVLSSADDSLGRFFSGVTESPTPLLTTAFVLIVFLIGAFLVWVELIVRASLIYLLVAFSPLLLAARVWPGAKGAFRKLVELGLALIVSKFAIALALGLGAAALGGGGPGNLGAPGPNPNDLGTQAGYTLAGLVGGSALVLLAAFSPFVILKVLPIFEGAVVAQGISRSPGRAAQTGMQLSYYGQMRSRIAGPGGGAPGLGGAGGGDAGPGPARPPLTSPPARTPAKAATMPVGVASNRDPKS